MRDIDSIVNNLGKTPFFRGWMGENAALPSGDGGHVKSFGDGEVF